MSKKLSRILVLALALALVVGVFAGCNNNNANNGGDQNQGNNQSQDNNQNQDNNQGGGTVKDTLIVATENETPSLTTVGHNAVAGDYMNKITHNSLFRFDMEMNPVPDLVESYETPDETTWVFKLKQGVKFHNGEEMKAEDVKASLELCKESPEVRQYGQGVESVEVVDEYTVKITTPGPYADLLGDLAHHGNAILPAKLIAEGHDFNADPIGTGPYKFVNWTLGDKIEFEAFADYFDGEPAIKYMTWRIIPEASSRTIALEADEVDVIIEIDGNDIDRLKSDSGITVMEKEGTSHNFMMINNEIHPFNNQDFRKAITAATDREAIVQVAFNGFASPSFSQLPMGFPGSSDEGGITYDPEKAKEYFAASGLNAADCGFAIICSNDVKVRAGQIVQDNLKQTLGIDVTIDQMDLATYLDKCEVGDYQAAIGGYTSNTMLAQVKGVYHSASINASNMTRTNLPEVDAMIDEAMATTDPSEQASKLQTLSKYMNELNPLVPLYQNMVTRAYNSNLQGFEANAGGTQYFDKVSWGN